jgi:hypothetical protein
MQGISASPSLPSRAFWNAGKTDEEGLLRLLTLRDIVSQPPKAVKGFDKPSGSPVVLTWGCILSAMTSDEIKTSANGTDNDWLKEIALQLAVLNERESIRRQVAEPEKTAIPLH